MHRGPDGTAVALHATIERVRFPSDAPNICPSGGMVDAPR